MIKQGQTAKSIVFFFVGCILMLMLTFHLFDTGAGPCWHVDLGLLTVMPVGSWPAMSLVFLDGINGQMGKLRNRVHLGNVWYEFWLVSLVLIVQPCSTWVQFFKLWVLEAPSWCDFKEFDVRNNSQVCLPEQFVKFEESPRSYWRTLVTLWLKLAGFSAFKKNEPANRNASQKKPDCSFVFCLGFHAFKHPLQPTFTNGFFDVSVGGWVIFYHLSTAFLHPFRPNAFAKDGFTLSWNGQDGLFGGDVGCRSCLDRMMKVGNCWEEWWRIHT